MYRMTSAAVRKPSPLRFIFLNSATGPDPLVQTDLAVAVSVELGEPRRQFLRQLAGAGDDRPFDVVSGVVVGCHPAPIPLSDYGRLAQLCPAGLVDDCEVAARDAGLVCPQPRRDPVENAQLQATQVVAIDVVLALRQQVEELDRVAAIAGWFGRWGV